MSKNDGSRHFGWIWSNIIVPSIEMIEEQADPDFKRKTKLKIKELKQYKRGVEREYRILRQQLKTECYGIEANEGILDGRKIAAVFCCALLKEKSFLFDTDIAYKILLEKNGIAHTQAEKLSVNRWLVDNVLMNYKLAYYVGLQIVYITLLHQMLENGNVKEAKLLNQKGHLLPYPQNPSGDSFDVNIILGMSKQQIYDQKVDMFLLAMQYYQIEMHTVDQIKIELLSKENI